MRRTKRPTIALIMLFIGMSAVCAFAQNAATVRPRIGLALGGGGALGLAHIGVLRFLEERRIPVHFIAGTSMGGLLAGFYATGHRSADLEALVKDTNWDDLFRWSPKFEHRPVVEKQNWNRITGAPLVLEFGGGLSLPAGINPGGPLALLLSRETLGYSEVRNFDDLPIPFRCVATDLRSGEAFILKQGFLAKALRATMAIPAIFTPVDWENRVLVDGGLINNLPTDVVKDMGADIVIGVRLHVNPSNPTQLDSIPGILRQSVNVSVAQNERRNLSLADVPVTVDLGDRESSDFSHPLEIIEIGYKAAQQYSAMLQPFSLSLSEWDSYLRDMNTRRRTVPVSGRLSAVDSVQSGIRKNATQELNRKIPSPVSVAPLEENLAGLIAASGLPSAFYGWNTPPAGKEGYRVELQERPNSQVLLRPTFFYQYSAGEPGRFTFRLSSSVIPKNAYKSRFLADISMGSSPGITFEAYRPFDGTAFFLAPGFSVQRTHYSEYIGGGRIDRTRDRLSGSLYFGMGTWRHLQLRVGSRMGYDRYSDELESTGFSDTGLVWVVNTQDSGDLPTKGTRINGSLGWTARSQEYPYFRTDFDHFHPLAKNLSAFTFGQVSDSFGRSLSFYDQFTAGGLTSLDAYRDQELRGNSVFTLGGGFLYRGINPAGSNFLPIPAGWYEAARLNPGSQPWQTRQSASAGVFLPTPVGKVGIVFSVNESGDTRFRLSLGSFWGQP